MNDNDQLPVQRNLILVWFIVVIVGAAFVPPSQAEELELMRFVEGLDRRPRAMTDDEIATELQDRFAREILSSVPLPSELSNVLDKLNVTPAMQQRSFVVGEAGQIRDPNWSAEVREYRLVISHGKSGTVSDVLIGVPAGDRDGALEVMSWDDTKCAFNFYERLLPNRWQWKGDSRHAWNSATARKACFRCHVNGAPIMKELDEPWSNWSTMSARIPPEHVPNLIRESDLYQNHLNADTMMEKELIRPWIETVLREQVSRRVDREQGRIVEPKDLIRPLFAESTYNLDSSSQRSGSNENPLFLPMNFFVNAEALSDIFPDVDNPKLDRARYNRTIQSFQVRLSDRIRETPGDTHFAFLVPVPSAEDQTISDQLVSQGIIPQRLAWCIALIDFPNPVFSSVRNQFWRDYAPTDVTFIAKQSNFAEQFIANVRAVVDQDISNQRFEERRFLKYWSLTDQQFENQVQQELTDYLTRVQSHLDTDEGLGQLMRLAESRRREFARISELDEFPLLFARSQISPSAWRCVPMEE
jgi:hypothetical protein